MNGMTALITGGGSGIGLATAKLFLERGANVVIAGRTASRLQEAAQSLNGGDRLKYFTGDVSSEGHANRIISNTVKAFGSLNILINNAGVFRGGDLLQMEEDDFDYNINVNLKGTWLMCRFAGRPMIAAGGGSIVNVSSYLAIRAHPSTPSSAYAAAKGGVLSLTRSLAVELAAHKIRVNAVMPAIVHTPMLETMMGAEAVPAILEKSKKAHPLGRAGEPEDVARTIAFLADPANSWLTGVEMTVDGGRSIL
jgi:NAD(P)-dependent dehydrogenase (short-subunit alcohol dehydrogenase family)